MHVLAHYLSGIAICQPRRRRFYLPLLLSFGVEDDGELLDDGEALDDELLVSDDAGGVPEADDELLDGGVLGDIDELDDAEPLGDDVVEGGVVDDEDDVDGDGVTTGGVVELLVELSRLQPAMPRTRPVQSSVTNAVFICEPP